MSPYASLVQSKDKSTRSMEGKKCVLSIDAGLANRKSRSTSFELSDQSFRQDGVSIGCDYLRLEGMTVSRGELMPAHLVFESSQILGRGAFSTVSLAHWKRPGTGKPVDVAVKQFSLVDTSSRQRHMLLKELKTLCQVECKSLVLLHGAFLETETVTMVLELMDCGSVETLVGKSMSGLDEGIVAALSYQIFSGLSFLHDRKILHRDIKPANILLHSSGHTKLCDFGLATLGEQSLSCTVLGTTKFMAPERLRASPYGKSSDIWSVGLVLLECVSGCSPWQDVKSLVDLVVTVEEVDENSLIPDNITRGLQEILLGCLRKEPAKRIPASLLMQSPWFAKECKIYAFADAVRQMRSYLSS